MIAQRVGIRALRQAAAKNPNAFFSHNLPRLALASNLQTRGAATQKLTQTDGESLLASQRRSRPVAPHITIYDYNQIWLGASIWTRFTGMAFTGGLYAFSIAYVVAPLTGWHLESASLVAAAASLPLAAKAALKFLVAWPFTFHAINGTRHLVWDFAKGFSKSTIHKGSWAIWGLSLGAALGMALLI